MAHASSPQRRRRTERDEDDTMAQDGPDDEYVVPYQFTESPSCT